MRTVVVGNRKLARHAFEHVVDQGWDVVGALVPDDRLASKQANFVPFEELTTEANCALHRTDDVNSDRTAEWLRGLDPDVCVCGGWSQIIEERILDIPMRGFLGFHSSRLPAGRGGAPVNWRLIDGADQVWISLFYYSTGVDSGDVIAQGSVPVERRDDVETVFDALAVAACDLLSTVRRDLEEGTVDATPQDDTRATYRPRRQPQDGLLDWTRDPIPQHDWIRAQTTPYPGAYTFHDSSKLTVYRAHPRRETTADGDPGEVLAVVDGEGIDVQTGSGCIRLERVQAEGRPVQWADRYACGAGIEPGDQFGREFAPDDWFATGIRGTTGGGEFDTNLSAGETGSVDVVVHTGSSREFDVEVTLDGEAIFDDTATVAGSYRKTVEYRPTRPGTHGLRTQFLANGETVDTRYLKLFVPE